MKYLAYALMAPTISLVLYGAMYTLYQYPLYGGLVLAAISFAIGANLLVDEKLKERGCR